MEQLGAVMEGEWASLSGMYTTIEESDFLTQLLGELSPASELSRECLGLLGAETSFCLSQTAGEDLFVYSSDPSSNLQETSAHSGSDGDMTNFVLSYHQLGDSNDSFAADEIPSYYNSVDFGFEEENVSSTGSACTNLMMQLDEGSNQVRSNTKVEAEVGEEKGPSPPADSKKRPRKAEAQKTQRNVKLRKSKKVTENTDIIEDKRGFEPIRQTSSSNRSKDEASAASEINSDLASEGSPPPSGKTRASRGSATDPQSLYARKRREKINERLKILQGLVPNGTKVDISTMLDEAVQYVKFLQLQIKLLSSDDLWMYAPLAYNGMDIGLDIKI